MDKLFLIWAGFMLIMSIIAFFLYLIDKRKAIKKKWRIKEATLLGFGFFGGALGALCSMKLFRHKTKHWYFWVINIIGLIWQSGLLVFLLIKSR